jgi:hypothetical protein
VFLDRCIQAPPPKAAWSLTSANGEVYTYTPVVFWVSWCFSHLTDPADSAVQGRALSTALQWGHGSPTRGHGS